MKKGMIFAAFLMMFLVVSMPIVFSYQMKDVEVVRVEVKTPLYQNTLKINSEPKNLDEAMQKSIANMEQMSSQNQQKTDVSEKCEEKSEKMADKLSFMDSGIIKAVEAVFNFARAICLTLNAIDSVLSSVGLIIGYLGPDGSNCCATGWLTLGIGCGTNWGIYQSWQSFHKKVQPICCWMTCGLCTTGCPPFGSILDGGGGGSEQVPKVGLYGAGKDYGEGSFFSTGGISAIGLSPYDNIYTSIACLCPGGILSNLRKLKTIYETYDCCIQQSCSKGMSTEGCEAMLDESTCMFWEGAIISSLAKIITKLILHAVFKYIILKGIEALWIKCILAIIELIQIPQTIQSVMAEWQRAMKTFDKVDCSDLGFEEIKQQFEDTQDDMVNKVPLQYEDFDGDGYVDGTAEEKKAYDAKKTQQTAKK